MSRWRKSWAELNIFGKNGDGKCTKRLLSPEVRSVWDDYLDLATISPIKGQVCIAEKIGYEQEQLAKLLHTSIEIIKKADEELSKYKCIKINEFGIRIISKWKQYQSEYDRQKHYRELQDELQDKVTGEGYPKIIQGDLDLDIDKRKYIINLCFELKGWLKANASRVDYARINKVINRLSLKTTPDKIAEGLQWLEQDAKQKGYSWTIETLEKKWLEFTAQKPKIKYV